MPQFLILAAVGAGLYAGYRALRSVGEKMAADMQKAQDELRQRAAARNDAKDLGTLSYDPISGEYKPVKRD
jgi:hypothetical protein